MFAYKGKKASVTVSLSIREAFQPIETIVNLFVPENFIPIYKLPTLSDKASQEEFLKELRNNSIKMNTENREGPTNSHEG